MRQTPSKGRNDRAQTSASAHASTLKKYGMTVQDYDAILARQGGVCPICLKRSEQMLCVDHDHKRRRRRALLCLSCNVGLGCYKDDPAAMRRGADYLEHWVREPGPLIPLRRSVSARSSTRRRKAGNGREGSPRSSRPKGRSAITTSAR